jgi:hypothetical protein
VPDQAGREPRKQFDLAPSQLRESRGASGEVKVGTRQRGMLPERLKAFPECRIGHAERRTQFRLLESQKQEK